MTATWDELGSRALARQFADLEVSSPSGVAEAVRRIGPIQSQTARSPFLGLAARFPGVTHEQITSAYEAFGIVRGSTIRGTVHTTVPEQHALLEVATRLGQRTLYQRALRLERTSLEQLWAHLEDLARDDWLSPQALDDAVRAWLETYEDPHAVRPESSPTFSRYLGFGHGGLVRRPLKGGWEGQGAPGYRTASALVGGRDGVLAAPDDALDDLFRVHLAAHGPSSRHDLAWWAGVGLTVVDRSLERLGLDGVEGPDGRRYVDLPGAAGAAELPGVRLLPEFDALFCAYEPSARQRIATPEHHRLLWNQNNGMVLPPLLVDGRVTGYWRAAGTARKRPLEVHWFAGTRRPRTSELEAPVAALESALALTITRTTLYRE